ncbi:MAG: DUF1343 domain-containing protein [Polyangiaceae bacterium]|nr:DUF1343 domain-containing protein [Polyangiaceae bacterium]
MLTGSDQLFSGQLSHLRRRLRDARVGALTHGAAVDRRGRSLLAVLEELGASPSLLLTPEHGLDGLAQAEEPVDSAEPGEGPRIVSLYGNSKESLSPSAEDLAQLDLLVIDLVDVGSRYYTYVWSALLAARAAAKAGVHVVVLDRPNPISGDPTTLEGAPQREGFLSFVGLEPLPIRHALTLGEIVALFAERDGLALGPEGALSIVPTVGWERFRTAAAWGRPFSPPSPNMPTLETALVYPGGCLLEGTNLSEGRGTTLPFQLIGAPYLDGARLARALDEQRVVGAQIRPTRFRPSFEKHAGEVCSGIFLQVTDPALFRPVAAYLSIIALCRLQAPEAFAFRTKTYEFEAEVPAFDLLTGSAAAREAIAGGANPSDVAELVCPVDASFKEVVLDAESRVARARA